MEDRDLMRELCDLLNTHSIESNSNTPDYILARFLINCLKVFDEATNMRSTLCNGKCEKSGKGN